MWTKEKISELFDKPLLDLLLEAQQLHRQYHVANQIQASSLLSIKTGACPEDCAYCPQSAHYNTGLQKEKLLPMETIIEAAKTAKAQGATRFCMGGAWRSPPQKAMPQLVEMVKTVHALGMETCMTVGMLNEEQVAAFDEAGLDYYNHNIDTSPEHYKKIISTRSFEDRLETLRCVSNSNIKVCCGGIMGMGETREDRVAFIHTLANLPKAPDSVPINQLIPIAGTPLAAENKLDEIEFVRTIAVARITMPTSKVRLSAGRESMSTSLHALCFMAGANSIFLGDKLLTAGNPSAVSDQQLLKTLGMTFDEIPECAVA